MASNSGSSSSSSSGGIGFTGALTIAFIVLKLCHVINWSWLWVLSPLWIGFAFAIVAMILFFGVVFLYEYNKDRKAAKRRAQMKGYRRYGG